MSPNFLYQIWTVTALRCSHVIEVEMSLAAGVGACGCAGSENRASNQVTVTICCYFNNTSKSSTCLSYSCSYMKVRSNGNDCLILDSVKCRDETIERISEPFGHANGGSQSPTALVLLQHAMPFTFMGKSMTRFQHAGSAHLCDGTAWFMRRPFFFW